MYFNTGTAENPRTSITEAGASESDNIVPIIKNALLIVAMFRS